MSNSIPAMVPLSQNIVDVNVHLSRWPFRRLPLDETPALVAKLRALGVGQAWAGSFDALLHKDIGAVNARLAEDCQRYGGGLLLPFGCVNPLLPDWEEELRRCHQDYKMRGIRLYPCYHGYTLEDSVFAKLLELAAARKLVIQIVVQMEDSRTLHPLVRVAPVNLAPLPALTQRLPQAKLVLLNALRTARCDAALAKLENLCFDTSMLEGVGGVGTLAQQIAPGRILLGSHAPFYYPEAAHLKMREAALEPQPMQAILLGNAKRLLEG